jgi:1,4-dihydroxy-2-naphthoyl-CoA hydrolase
VYAELDLLVPFERSFDSLYGLEIVAAESEHARARIEAGPHLHGPDGRVHGGVFFAAAESLTSAATALAVVGDGRVAAGLSNTTVVHAPVEGGVLDFVARRQGGAGGEWVWTVEARDAAGAVVATSTVVIAVRPT